jgi:hypothetical protein
MNRETMLRRRISLLTWVFIAGLLLSGVTAIPLRQELDALVNFLGVGGPGNPGLPQPLVAWLLKTRDALGQIEAQQPFLFYGTDWLAFGHFAIALAFIGVLRDPVRNVWIFTFGLLACVMVIPYAFVFGAVRGIPVWWRLVDCSFGVFGFIPLWCCRRWALELEAARGNIGHGTSREPVGTHA